MSAPVWLFAIYGIRAQQQTRNNKPSVEIMKKKLIAVVTLAVAFNITSHSAEFVITTTDDGVIRTSATTTRMFSPAINSPQNPNNNVFLFNSENIVIESLCSSISPNKPQSYINTMLGLAGVSVPTDRTSNPAAWYVIPPNGLQWFDGYTTTFKSWLGSPYLTNSATANDNGSRFVVSVCGTNDVSRYSCMIYSSLTNLAPVTFPIGTNTSNGQEIPFNANYVGISVGSDGILESYPSAIAGGWVQNGDDTVLVTNQLPSQSTYNWFYRFGATVVINATSIADFKSVQDQFATTNQWITATLMRDGVIVASRTVSMSMAFVQVSLDGNYGMKMVITGGQQNMTYKVQTTPSLSDPIAWKSFDDNLSLSPGEPYDIGTTNTAQFYRAVLVAP